MCLLKFSVSCFVPFAIWTYPFLLYAYLDDIDQSIERLMKKKTHTRLETIKLFLWFYGYYVMNTLHRLYILNVGMRNASILQRTALSKTRDIYNWKILKLILMWWHKMLFDTENQTKEPRECSTIFIFFLFSFSIFSHFLFNILLLTFDWFFWRQKYTQKKWMKTKNRTYTYVLCVHV